MTDLTDRLLIALQHDYSSDYWSDAVLPAEVAPLARAMSADDWQALVPLVASQSLAWCKRLADAAASTRDAAASPPLVAMLRRAEPEAGIAAAEALLAILYDWTPKESLLADLDRHIAAAPSSSAAPLLRLRGRLPA